MKHPRFDQQITFLNTKDLEKTRAFYSDLLGLALVRDQGTCLIFKTTNEAYLGFCEHIETIESGRRVILTLVTDNVDEWYQRLKEKDAPILDPPKSNPKYHIYHFFLTDPNGYWVEIQKFDEPL